MTRVNWWLTEYASDVFEYLLLKERSRYRFQGKSIHLQFRGLLVQLISEIASKHKLSTSAKHLGVYLLDTFMDNHIILSKHIKFLALGCLLVAAKLEDNERTIPKVSKLNCYVKNSYTSREFFQLEVSILIFFKWDIIVPTQAHFADYFMTANRCTVPGEEIQNISDLTTLVEYFLEMSIKNKEFLQFLPSLIGASCVGAARHCLGLHPSWVKKVALAGFHCKKMYPVMNLLLKMMKTERISRYSG